jgi:hypothetical protein
MRHTFTMTAPSASNKPCLGVTSNRQRAIWVEPRRRDCLALLDGRGGRVCCWVARKQPQRLSGARVSCRVFVVVSEWRCDAGGVAMQRMQSRAKQE